MIDQLLARLRGVDIQLTPQELAEALWLAQYLPAPSPPAEPVPSPSRVEPERPPPEPESHPEPPAGQPPPLPPPGVSQSPEEARLVRPGLAPEGADTAVPGSLVRAPGTATLPHALKLGQALRPLRRRVPSRTRVVLDEAATAYQMAESRGRLWSPVFKPEPTRWLDLALVVDGSPSMAIWSQTLSELERLLERLGAFRDIRRWTLETTTPHEVRLYAGRAAPEARATRPPRELLDPTGRRLVLVVSDCIAPAWGSGAVMQALSAWGHAGPVALVQVLPQRLWVRTGLGSATRVSLRGRSPGAANVQLEAVVRGRGRSGRPVRGLPLPVFPLDPPSLTEWAHLLAGGSHPARGLVLPPAPWEDLGAEEGPDAPSPTEPHALLQAFRGTASPLAQQLAGMLSAAPLYLPAMRLVQRVMLPESQQVHLAEVLMGGLVRQAKRPSAPATTQEDWYDFQPGVRPLLLDSLTRGGSLDVLRHVADFMGMRFGRGRDFMAALVAPDGDIQLEAGEANEPFAMVAATVLRRLGGRYARLADNLQPAAANSSSPGDSHPEHTLEPSETDGVLREDERIWRACGLAMSGAAVANAYLVAPRRFITTASFLDPGEQGLGGDLKVRTAIGWLDATVIGMDTHSDCAVLELDSEMNSGEIAPLDLKDTSSSMVVDVYGTDLESLEAHDLVRYAAVFTYGPPNGPLGDLSPFSLSLDDEQASGARTVGMPIIENGRVLGHVAHRSLLRPSEVRHGVCSAAAVRRLLYPEPFKPRGQWVYVTVQGHNTVFPESVLTWTSQLLGERLAREGYGLMGVERRSPVGRAYLATLRLLGVDSKSFFRRDLHDKSPKPSALVFLGGTESAEIVFEDTLLGATPVLPLPWTGKVSAHAYAYLLQHLPQSALRHLTRQELEELNGHCMSREDAEALVTKALALLGRAMAPVRQRPAAFAKAMLGLLIATEPRFMSARPTQRPGTAWRAYADELAAQMGGSPSNFMGHMLERLGSLVVTSGTSPEAQRYDAIAALRQELVESGSWLRAEATAIARIEDPGDLRWRLLVQLVPLLLESVRDGFITVSEILKQMKSAGASAYEQQVLRLVEDHFAAPAQYRAWLLETLGQAGRPVVEKSTAPMLMDLARAYLDRRSLGQEQRILAQLSMHLTRMGEQERAILLPSWLESTDAAKRVLAYVLLQCHPLPAAFNRLVQHLGTVIGEQPVYTEPRLVQPLLVALIFGIEVGGVAAPQRSDLGKLVQRSLEWRNTQSLEWDPVMLPHLRLLAVLCQREARPMPGLFLLGPDLVLERMSLKRGAREWVLSMEDFPESPPASWRTRTEHFKSLPPREQFVAFGQEAHFVRRGKMQQKKRSWQLSFEVPSSLPRQTFEGQNVRVEDFIARQFSLGFRETHFWSRLQKGAEQFMAPHDWAHMRNNLLRLEVVRLAALATKPFDHDPGSATLRCITRVWNVVALDTSSKHAVEVGMVLDINGYGLWAGVVQLTRP